MYVEVDIEKGITEAIHLNLDSWKHYQILDYEQLPFRCNACHEYMHFSKNYKSAQKS